MVERARAASCSGDGVPVGVPARRGQFEFQAWTARVSRARRSANIIIIFHRPAVTVYDVRFVRWVRDKLDVWRGGR